MLNSGLSRRRRRGQVPGWSPLALFANNEVGVWYDPSDLSPEKVAWRRNLLTYSEQFDNAAWVTDSRLTIGANTTDTTAPNGTNTADKGTETTDNGSHRVYQIFTTTLNTTFTASCYMKKGTRQWVWAAVNTRSSGVTHSTSQVQFFDLDNLALGQQVEVQNAGSTKMCAFVSASITDAGNGWRRIALTITTQNTPADMLPTFGLASANGTNVYAGATDQYGYFWGAQLELGSTATTYQRITDFSSDFLAAFPTHTLYQNSAGTTPVTALGQPVGLVLDNSQGALSNIGPQLVTNGTFATDSDWTKGTGWSIGSGVATKSAGTASVLSQAETLTAGALYQITYTMTRTAGTLTPRFTGTTTVNATARTADGTYTEYLVAATGNNALEFSADASFAGTVDNVSLRLVPGHHARQTTDAARPTLQARSNLLTYSEQFDNAAWTKSNATVTTNTTVAPDGTTTADTLTGTGSYPFASQGVTVVAGTVLTASYWIAKTSGLADGSYPMCSIEYRTASAAISEEGVVIDTNTGTGINNSGWGTRNPASFSVVSDGNYWKVTLTTQNAQATSTVGRIYIGVSGGYANGTRRTTAFPLTSIVIWGAQLELGSTATTYQRVVTATDYADVGFPRNLTFDGTDDSLVTAGNVNFSGTDKMTVCAGVFKQTDATFSVPYELSASIAANNGVFRLAILSGGPTGYNFGSKGTSQANADISSASFAAPNTSVITGTANIAGDSVVLRLNGTQVGSSTDDQGTGNYGSYPVYVGRRGSVSDPFNGRIHQLIVRGAATDTATIQQTERYVAQKTGLVI